MDDSLPWAEKYRPTTLDQVIGNGTAIATLKKWAQSWEEGTPAKRAVVLSGRAGVGKTSTAHALAADLGWGVIELNASDARNEEAIKRVATAGALNETFRDDGAFIRAAAGGRKLIILDEADNVFGSEDRGGLPAIVDMIRSTKQPVVLIVNDYYGLTRRSSTIKSLALEIKFQALRAPSIEKVLRTVAVNEHVEVAAEVIAEIGREAHGDLRAALNDLEAAARGHAIVAKEAASMAGGRDNRQSAYGMVEEVLRTFDVNAARTALRELDEAPGFALLWIEENVPLAYRHPEDLEMAFYYLSRADQMMGRTIRRQYFGLWSYASDLMGPGVALSKGERLHGWSRYQFPSWLLQMGRSKAMRKRRATTYGKLGAYFHTSRREIAASVAPYLPRLMEADFDLAVNVAAGAGLDLEDVADLLDKEVESKEVQAIVHEAKRLIEEGASLGAAAESKRGARKGSMSLAEAVDAVKEAEKAKKPAKKAKKEPPPEPAPPPPEEKPEAPAEPPPEEPDPTRNRSLLDF